jgi:bifunctional aspartokinase / homoserine dehydrogenase 1
MVKSCNSIFSLSGARMSQSSPQKTLVMKFGGTSVGSVSAMTQVIEIVRQGLCDWPRLVVVASALNGVTNLLLDSANRSALGDREAYRSAVAELRTRHMEMIETLVTVPARGAPIAQEIEQLIEDFASRCQAISVLNEATPRALDAIAGIGERMCVRVLAGALESAGMPAAAIEATRMIVTDDRFQSAHPKPDATALRTRQALEPILKQGQVAVVTGFIGATPAGIPTTLGRGGSDYSAALLGAALPADEVWIWTDVDGVMTADPRLVPDARTIPVLSYREVSELAYFGAKVLHPKTIRPVIEAGIGLRVCNTFNPQQPGTRLVAELPAPATGVIKAVTAISGLQMITIEGRGMMGVPGVAARTFGAVAATGTSVPLISQASSEQSICFAVPVEATRSVLAALQNTFATEIASRDIDRVWATDEVVIITVVGAGMRSTPGVAGRVFNALGEKTVNVIAIAQGSSEVSISLIIDAADTRAAMKSLHALIV